MKKLLQLFTTTLISYGAFAQVPFVNEIAPSFGNPTVKFDPTLFQGDYSSNTDMLDVLAISADCTVYDKVTDSFSPMKGNISNIFPVQNGTSSSEQDSSVTVYASFDKNEKNEKLGDGGGLVYFRIARTKAGKWNLVSIGKVGNKYIYFENVDFSSIGGTINNKAFTSTGTVSSTTQRFLVNEDISMVHSNKDLLGFADTSDFEYPASVTKETQKRSVVPKDKILQKYLSLGWPVEVDAISGKVIGRLHRLGRGASSIVHGRQNILYFVYPGNPSVLMRYDPTQSEDLNISTNLDLLKPSLGFGNLDNTILLYAYKQTPNGEGDFTIPIAFKVDSLTDPDNSDLKMPAYSQMFDSLLVAKEVALRAGATMFANIGDLAITANDIGDDVILITEKGIDDSGDWYNNPAKKFNGVLALHLKALDTKDLSNDGNFKDSFGRILAISGGSGTTTTTVLTEGGVSNGNKFFSNPDKMETSEYFNAKTGTSNLLFTVKENIPATDKGRNPGNVPYIERTNEAYFLQIESNIAAFLPTNGVSVTPIPFDQYKLYESGSKGSMLSSSFSNNSQTVGNVFLANSKVKSGVLSDTYLSVINGYNGTDKSMIVALRGINDNFLTGLEENEEGGTKGFSAWPNPSSGIIQVKEVSDYIVSDVSGNLVKSFQSTQTLDMSELEKGMYFLKKSNGSVKKIVLQ